MGKRVEEELERRRDEIEAEVMRRVEEAKKIMEAKMMEEMERRKKEQQEEIDRREEEDKQRRVEAERIMVENVKKKGQKRSKRKFLEKAMLDPNCRSAFSKLLHSIFFRFFLNFFFFNGLQIVYFFPKSINKTSFSRFRLKKKFVAFKFIFRGHNAYPL